MPSDDSERSAPTTAVSVHANLRPLTVVAQDPAVRVDGKPLLTRVEVPAERLASGPWGYRVQVIDYDASTGQFYPPPEYADGADGKLADPFEAEAAADPARLVANRQFHSQNVYAIVMRILARFEFALGRRIGWSFGTHQLKVVPHAFAQANAFYSSQEECLLFGYFPGSSGTVFSCLSHDVIAHETTHALLDGLRSRFQEPSLPDQPAFHEAFADVVALLSVFALEDVVRASFALEDADRIREQNGRTLVRASALTEAELKRSILLGLAEEMGQEISQVRGRPLRRSVDLEPGKDYMQDPEFEEPHRRGELLVAAMMTTLLRVMANRLDALDAGRSGWLDLDRVVEEAAAAADTLLNVVIRAIDYTMPVHITFADFLSAMLTADREVVGDDSRFHYRDNLRTAFADYGIHPASGEHTDEAGLWGPPQGKLHYGRVHFRSLQTDLDEVFRFLWDNRDVLRLYPNVYTRVLSVRPCVRLGPDGFFLRETVAEYLQMADVRADELREHGIKKPADMPDSTQVMLLGGGTLVFDEFGQLKFNIINRINDGPRQSRRIEYLWSRGYYRPQSRGLLRDHDIAGFHRLRSLDATSPWREAWL